MTNIGSDCYWCNQPTFVDLVKAAECWRSGWTECTSPGKSLVPLDPQGWPTRTPSGDVARMILGPVYRTGTYVVTWQGKGTFTLQSRDGAVSKALTVTATGPGTATFVAEKQGTVALEISATDGANHLRNFSVVHQALAATATTQPFYPELLDYLKGYAAVRFMDWTQTNNSNQVNWADHTPSYAYNQAVTFEGALQLCNALHRDCWLTVPAKATDAYVKSLATLVRDTLDPTLKLWLEYSNEDWNFAFTQAAYCRDQGVARALPGDPYEAGFRFHAQRSKEVFGLFGAVFGGSAMQTRVVRVVAGQASNSWIAQTHINQIGVASMDVYAIAPYFSYESVDAYGGQADGWTLDQLFARMSATDVPVAIAQMQSVAAALKPFGVPMISYEGGQSLAGNSASAHARTLFEQAQTDNRMYGLYQRYFDAWKASGGRYFNHYTALGSISGQYGSWGLKPSLDTPDAKAPKYRALKDWDSAHPRWW